MAEISKRQTAEILRSWIECVNDEGRGLTNWEKSFMESITEQFDLSGSLSPAQEQALERIYASRT